MSQKPESRARVWQETGKSEVPQVVASFWALESDVKTIALFKQNVLRIIIFFPERGLGTSLNEHRECWIFCHDVPCLLTIPLWSLDCWKLLWDPSLEKYLEGNCIRTVVCSGMGRERRWRVTKMPRFLAERLPRAKKLKLILLEETLGPVGGTYVVKEKDLSLVKCCFCAGLQVDTLHTNFHLIPRRWFRRRQLLENKMWYVRRTKEPYCPWGWCRTRLFQM